MGAACPTPLPVSALGIGISCCDVSPLRVEHRLYKRATYSGSLPHRGIAYVKENNFRRFLLDFAQLPVHARVSIVTGGDDAGAPFELFGASSRQRPDVQKWLWPEPEHAEPLPFNVSSFLSDRRLVHWSAQNFDVGCNRLTGCSVLPRELRRKLAPLPIGVWTDPFEVVKECGYAAREGCSLRNLIRRDEALEPGLCKLAQRFEQARVSVPPFAARELRLLVTFRCPATDSRKPEREPACAALVTTASSGSVRPRSPLIELAGHQLDTARFWSEVGRFAFVPCPSGRGLDTHRVWEALALGAVPIVISSSLDGLYSSFPVVTISDWSELALGERALLVRLRAWRERIVQRFGQEPFGARVRGMLTSAYWAGRIQARHDELVDTDSAPGAASSVSTDAAYEFIGETQLAPCADVGLVRMPSFGVANDLNQVVKALHWVTMWERDRSLQLVLLPPDAKARAAVHMTLDVHHPWHWLRQHPLSEALQLSACHRQLLAANASWLAAVAADGLTHALQLSAPSGVRFTMVSPPPAAAGRCERGSLPPKFASAGCLWWWTALTSYLVRIRERLAEHVLRHVSLQSAAWLDDHGRATMRNAPPFGLPRRGLDGRSSVLFRAGLHVRMGDACGPRAPAAGRANGQAGRRCVATLAQALDALPSSSSGGDVFLATDSDAMVQKSRSRRTAAHGVQLRSLELQRAKYDHVERIEHASAANRDELEILTEALLEITMLARSEIIVGSMFGNVPRLALQLRVPAAGGGATARYVSLDGYEWCIDSRCVGPLPPTCWAWGQREAALTACRLQ